jgi:hypothetical protein
MMDEYCCDDFRRARAGGSDDEGCGSAISDGLKIGYDLPPISYCPWCGQVVRESEPQNEQPRMTATDVLAQNRPYKRDMREGERVEVRLYGDERWFPGTVLDRPRKMWVQLDPAAYGDEFIADENCIAEWRPMSG